MSLQRAAVWKDLSCQYSLGKQVWCLQNTGEVPSFSPFGQVTRRVLACMLRDVRLDSNTVYSPSPLNVKSVPSKVKK